MRKLIERWNKRLKNKKLENIEGWREKQMNDQQILSMRLL